MKMPETTNYVDAQSFSAEQLQSITNFVISMAIPQSTNNEQIDYVIFKYANGLNVTVPRPFSLIQGHKLEEQLKAAFPQFLRYKNEPDLKRAVIGLVLDDFPGLIPQSFIDLFKKIQFGAFSSNETDTATSLNFQSQ